jgi:hypothetical protein
MLISLRDLISNHHTTPNVPKLLTTLQTIHLKLLGCVKQVNLIFSFQTMLCLSLSFLFTFFTIINAYKSFFGHFGNRNSSLSSIYWCFYYNLLTTLMIIFCERTHLENEEMAKLIYKLMNKNLKCHPLILQSFGNQVRGQSVKSSCGLFNFDLQLIVIVSRFLKLQLLN